MSIDNVSMFGSCSKLEINTYQQSLPTYQAHEIVASGCSYRILYAKDILATACYSTCIPSTIGPEIVAEEDGI